MTTEFVAMCCHHSTTEAVIFYMKSSKLSFLILLSILFRRVIYLFQKAVARDIISLIVIHIIVQPNIAFSLTQALDTNYTIVIFCDLIFDLNSRHFCEYITMFGGDPISKNVPFINLSIKYPLQGFTKSLAFLTGYAICSILQNDLA